ncbi:hypothetical protein [Natrinema sp. 1APR25-10V2]|uniref:DUF7504 family protein n=1 Tax=Natrinema sp. 1APR25-10V2 TaxID=2951081 RepID=UPI002873FEA8|nr:hypothetical protein [Natrinema sp. 1APR25-10V2]MDS0477101.1 hypothetical protein [Natrinema sp. 1APR25-10V2]
MGTVELESGSNKLLLTPLPYGDTTGSFLRQLNSAGQTSPVILVSLRCAPTEIVDFCRTHIGETNPITDVIYTEDVAYAPPARLEDFGVPSVTITSIGNSDLTGLGTAVSEAFSQYTDSVPMQLWFDSITSLLDVVDLETAFRFLHVVTARVENAGATAFYHADPAAHDPQTINSLRYLFDDVIELDRS